MTNPNDASGPVDPAGTFDLIIERLRETGREDAASFLDEERDAILDLPSSGPVDPAEVDDLAEVAADANEREKVLEAELARVRAERDAAQAEVKIQNGWAHEMIRERELIAGKLAAAEARVSEIREDTVAEILVFLRSAGDTRFWNEPFKASADFIEREFPAPVQADTQETSG